MATCSNDFSPIITQIAIAIPILVGIIVTWLNLKISQQKQRAGHDTLVSKVDSVKDTLTGKVDALTTITVNGFHSPPISPLPQQLNQLGNDQQG